MIDRDTRPRTALAALATVLLFCAILVPEAAAGPANPTPFMLVQPDGVSFMARAVGDEWANGQETLDGYAILRDPQDGYWKYADNGPANTLVLSPYAVTRVSPAGRVTQRLRVNRAQGAPAASSALPPMGIAALGTRPTLVILAQFTDKAGITTPAAWQASFFGTTNSVKHHYAVSSYNQMTITPAAETQGTANDGVVGWVSLSYAHPNTRGSFATANQQLSKDAILAANPFVNFAAYDTNGNGRVEPSELMVVVIVAGNETSFGGTANSCAPSVWGHKWSIFQVTPPVVDNVSVGGDGYGQFGEIHCQSTSPPGQQATIGIMAHEMGHLLGLPDLYDTDSSSEGIGSWSLMATGSWNRVSRSGDSPALLDPWSKAFLGWTTPTLVTGTLTNQSIPASETTNVVYQFRTGSALTATGEYFLVENRQRTSYDVGLPGAGLLIWHIDEAETSNREECIPGGTPACSASIHYKVALVQADNLFDLERISNRGDAGDPFPGTAGNRSWTDATSPSARLWSGTASGISVSNISDSASQMTATLSVGGAAPAISVTPSSQDFGTVMIGQTADRTFSVSNSGSGTLVGSASVSAPFSIVSGASYSLTAGASQTVTVRFSPTTAAGPFSGNVSFSVTGGTGVTRAVTGTTPGSAQPPCTTSITSGATVSGSLTDASCASLNRPPAKGDRYTFSGSAGQSVTITMMAPTSFVDTYLYLMNSSGTVIASNNDCSATTLDSCINNFALATSGSYTIEATSSDSTARGSYSLTLSAAGPILTVTPATLSFGIVPAGSSATQDFTVRNSGNGTLTGTATTSAPFSVTSGGSYTLAAGASQTVTVRFAPVTAGAFNGTASFSSSGGAPEVRALTGQAAVISCVNVPFVPGETSAALTDSDCDAAQRSGARSDHYTFSGVAGLEVTVNMNSTAFDTYVFLVGPSGAVIASNDDCPGLNTFDSCITAVVLPSDGTYTIEATAHSTAGRGAYTLTLETGAPAVSLVFSSTTPDARQQVSLRATIPTPSTRDVTGTVTLAFAPNAVVPIDDPAIQFATGGRVVTFTIPANTTEARFDSATEAGPVGFQTGTVAGTLTFTATFASGTANGTVSAPLSIPRQAPVLLQIQTSSQGGFKAMISLYSTTRDVTEMSLTFNTTPAVRLSCGSLAGCSTSGNTLTLSVASLFTAWFQGNATFGSVSTLTLPLSIEGGTVQGTVEVRLRNSQGQSNAMSFALP